MAPLEGTVRALVSGGESSLMDAVEVFRVKSGGGPFEMGGGDELLGARGQGAEECIATPRVEFSEDVIEEEEGGAAVEGVEEAGLSEFEGEGEGALLSFRGEGSGGPVVEDEWKVVAVRADQRESASSFLRVAGGQSGGEVGGRTPLIGNLESFG
jgi:hypothetical protein